MNRFSRGRDTGARPANNLAGYGLAVCRFSAMFLAIASVTMMGCFSDPPKLKEFGPDAAVPAQVFCGALFCLEFFSPQSFSELGADLGEPIGLEFREGRLLALGDIDDGVIIEFELGNGNQIGRVTATIDLDNDVGPEAPFPTGLSRHGNQTVLGNLREGVSTLLFIDWDAARSSQSLNATVFEAVIDDLGVSSGPEVVTVGAKGYVAVADVQAEQVRLYDPAALASADKTSDLGVLSSSFSTNAPINSMFYDTPSLMVIQSTAVGATLRVIDLTNSISMGQEIDRDVIEIDVGASLTAFHRIDRGRVALLGSQGVSLGRLVAPSSGR